MGFHEQGLENVNREMQALAYLEIPAAKVPGIEEGLGVLQNQVADIAAALHRLEQQQGQSTAELAQQKQEISRLQAERLRTLQNDQQCFGVLLDVQEELQRLTLQVVALGQSPATQGPVDGQLFSALRSSQGNIKSLFDKLEEQGHNMERMHKEHAEAQGLVQMEMEEMRTMLGSRLSHATLQPISNLPETIQETTMPSLNHIHLPSQPPGMPHRGKIKLRERR